MDAPREVVRIAHVSDTHGNFPELGSASVVVHSGDLLPNAPLEREWSQLLMGIDAVTERRFQEHWVRRKIHKFMGWLRGRTFIFCAGNHDYFDPVPFLQRVGIDAHNITNAHATVNGYTFYGFPYVPVDCHPWNYAIPDAEMAKNFDGLASLWEEQSGFDVLVTHCPPAGIMDRCPKQGKRFGNGPLNDFFAYKVTKLPKMLLCGHIHGDNAVTFEMGTLISQAATRVHQLELRDT
jgi:Icc-related predicted phosphoesterase